MYLKKGRIKELYKDKTRKNVLEFFLNVPSLWKIHSYNKISSFAIKLLSCLTLTLASHKRYWIYLAPVDVRAVPSLSDIVVSLK